MPGDYTRLTFNPLEDHLGVLMQQGRVMVDADFNELVDIVNRRFRAETIDIIGRCVVPRETPVTRSHLLHLVELIDAGAVVLPASPGFYGSGANATAQQLIDFVAGKVLDAAGVPNSLLTRWTGEIGTR